LTVEDLKKQVLVPIEATITEAISEPFRAVVQLVSTDRTLDLRASLGKEALLTLHHAAGTRHVHGIVSHVRIAGPTRENHRYELTIVPRIWLLSCRQNCRIFQGASVVDIVQEVCESVGMSDIDPRVSGHTPRDFCVQYRETDLAFIQRLLAEEGICYFFQHTDGKHTLILSDHNIHHDDHGMGAARYDSSSMSGGTDSVIRRLTHDHLIRPGALALRDHAFRDPNNPLSAYAEHAADTDYEVYDYPGNYVSDELGGPQGRLATRCPAGRSRRRAGCLRSTLALSRLLRVHRTSSPR
jgi:type VI secretion system secreted protein VgrG